MSSTPHLDRVRVASPCTEDWGGMRGDDRARRCDSCRLTVYNLSDMTREEAEAFLAARARKGRTCAHFFRRRDGTVLTRDCPRGLRDRALQAQMLAAALLGAVFSLGAVDIAAGGPTAQRLGPAITYLKKLPPVRMLARGARWASLGETVDGDMDLIDSNL